MMHVPLVLDSFFTMFPLYTNSEPTQKMKFVYGSKIYTKSAVHTCTLFLCVTIYIQEPNMRSVCSPRVLVPHVLEVKFGDLAHGTL